MMYKPKFKVGQVVRINTDWYKKEHKGEQYQRIIRVWPWGNRYGYDLLCGDACHEKYLAPLTARELQ
jgi:hypothetical protein